MTTSADHLIPKWKPDKFKAVTEIEYLATPYTDEDPGIEDYRARISDIIAAELTSQGRLIYAPISSWHHIALKYELPSTYDYWLKLDEEFLKVCKQVVIITLPGWQKSKGVNAEVKMAKKYNIPINYIDPEPFIKKAGLGEKT